MGNDNCKFVLPAGEVGQFGRALNAGNEFVIYHFPISIVH